MNSTEKKVELLPLRRTQVHLDFKPEDCWIGVFWRQKVGWVDIWICLVPMLPIHISIFKRIKKGRERAN